MRISVPILVLATLSACVSDPVIPGSLEYREIPEALLQDCTLPQIPENTAEMSDGFVVAYKCAQLGNADKAAIRELIK